jgi:hypothetical protein
MSLRCARQDDPGTVLIEGESISIGPVGVQEGMVRCYDVPYANFNGSDH